MYSIITTNLTKKFKDKIAVNGINLSIKEGEHLNGFHGAVGQETWDSLIIKYIGKELFDKNNYYDY